MKKLLSCLAIGLLVFSGCSKKEETAVQGSEAPPPPVPEEVVEQKEQPAAKESSGTESELTAKIEEMKESLPTPEELEGSGSGSSMPSLASGLDWGDFSWDQVSEVPYANKEELAVWAGKEVEEWKGKLTEAAKTQGMSMLSNLGDSGWQGALKDVVDAIEGVRQANPDTWAMARGALKSSWEQFQEKAMDVIGEN